VRGESLRLRLGARELSLVAGLSALLAVASTVPPSAAIGGLGFISFGAVLVPVIAWLLKPKEALLSWVVGSLGISAH
jgi:xanthosine utilization system XapX-like protein